MKTTPSLFACVAVLTLCLSWQAARAQKADAPATKPATAPATTPASAPAVDHAAARLKWLKLQRVNFQDYLKKYDLNGDGKISQEEREAGLKGWHEELAKAYIDGWDVDGDGKVSDEEFRTGGGGAAQKEELSRQERKEVMDKYDLNRDGKLDESEQALQKGDQLKEVEQLRVKAILQRYDKNGNGILDADEQAALAKDKADDVKREAGQKQRMEEEQKKLLEKWGTDKDGKISPEEWKARNEEVQREMLKKKAAETPKETPKDASKPATQPATQNADNGPQQPGPGAVEKTVTTPNGTVRIVTHGGARLTNWRPPGARVKTPQTQPAEVAPSTQPATHPATQPSTQPTTAP